MSDDGETEPARIILINGATLDALLPKHPMAMANWLKTIWADHWAVIGNVFVPVAAIACIMKGDALQRGPMPAMPENLGRPN